jgi:hypothetical protein
MQCKQKNETQEKAIVSQRIKLNIKSTCFPHPQPQLQHIYSGSYSMKYIKNATKKVLLRMDYSM